MVYMRDFITQVLRAQGQVESRESSLQYIKPKDKLKSQVAGYGNLPKRMLNA